MPEGVSVSKAVSQDKESPLDENPASYRKSTSVFPRRVLAGTPPRMGRVTHMPVLRRHEESDCTHIVWQRAMSPEELSPGTCCCCY